MKNNRDGIKRKETTLGWCGTQYMCYRPTTDKTYYYIHSIRIRTYTDMTQYNTGMIQFNTGMTQYNRGKKQYIL